MNYYEDSEFPKMYIMYTDIKLYIFIYNTYTIYIKFCNFCIHNNYVNLHNVYITRT